MKTITKQGEIRNSKFEIRNSAFTLIELIISIALLGIILVASSTIFATALKNYRTNSQKSFFQKELNLAIDNIGKDVKQATSVPTTQDTHTTSSNTLILALPSIDGSGNFIYTGDVLEKDYYVYYLNGQDVKKRIYANSLSSRYNQDGQDIIILSNVTNLNYTYLPANNNPDQVKVDITLEKTVGNSNVSVSGSKLSNLRNKE